MSKLPEGDPFLRKMEEDQAKAREDEETEAFEAELMMSVTTDGLRGEHDTRENIMRMMSSYYSSTGKVDRAEMWATRAENAGHRRVFVPYTDDPNDAALYPDGSARIGDIVMRQYNCVSVAHLFNRRTDAPLSLTTDMISRSAWALGLEHNPVAYAASMRRGHPRGGPICTPMLFILSGHVVLTGSKHRMHQCLWLAFLLRDLRHHISPDICLRAAGMVVQNAVFRFICPFGVDYQRMAKETGRGANGVAFVSPANSFEGVYIRLPENDTPEMGCIVILVFYRGVGIITGPLGPEKAVIALRNALPLISRYRVDLSAVGGEKNK